MADITKRGGRHYLPFSVGHPNWFEQVWYLPSVGLAPAPPPYQRTIRVGFRPRTILVPLR